jgi:MFS family permease
LQLGTGWASDVVGRRPLIVGGMLLQGSAIAVTGLSSSFGIWILAVSLLGLGTAMVYPTLLAAISDAVHPQERSTTLGVYRFWRDAGAMAGALIAGALTDLFGLEPAIQTVAAVTVASGIIAALTLKERPVSGQPLAVGR